jgi:S-formylglutathione hydrolase FrmB
MRAFVAAALALVATAPATAQVLPVHTRLGLDWVNRRIGGQVVDYTNNHGSDNRIFSPILGHPRDLYVYLPPGYNPCTAYPLLLDFHVARLDETLFITSTHLIELDDMIRAGLVPPVVVAMPDGSIEGRRGPGSPSSFFVNGVNGRFEDHILQEVVPFVMSHYSIRPERQAHAIAGGSAGGYGALSIAIRHRDFFATVVTMSAALNILYTTCHDDVLEDFDPETFRWQTVYRPRQVVGRFYFGLFKVHAKDFAEPVFGSDPNAVIPRVQTTNPASLIDSTGLQPGELAIYLGYGEKDQFNFDAHAESFAWLAAQRGISVTLAPDPRGRHNRRYFTRNQRYAFAWLGQRILPPVSRATPALEARDVLVPSGP